MKTILITGASSGIGNEVATYLHKKGYKVYGTSRNPQKVTDVDFKMVQLDVLDTSSIKKAVETIISAEGKIDILINNAGKGLMGAVEDMPTDEIRAGFETNFFGVIEMLKAVLPTMRKQKNGLIINVTSIAGYSGLPFRGAYSSSKCALEILSESINMEVKQFGVRITTVAPGSFATNIASGRYYTPVFDNSPYKETYSKSLKIADEYVDEGLNPIIMAKAIEKIINTKNPKIHYKVSGFMEKFSVSLKRILPDLWYEKLLMNHYKL